MAFTEKDSPRRAQLNGDIRIPDGIKSAIVFGHADGDGHLAAVQSREWLVRQGVDVTVVVSRSTRNHFFWHRLVDFDLSEYDLVAFVDIAFRFRDPDESLAQLLRVADRLSDTHFVAVDHHPFVHPDVPRENVVLIEVDDPYRCCLGLPDPELMQVAALCDGSPTAIVPTPLLTRRALGVKRAAADVAGIAGDTLLGLISERRWGFFEALAVEAREMHLSARGIRRRSSKDSPLIDYARSHPPSATPKWPLGPST